VEGRLRNLGKMCLARDLRAEEVEALRQLLEAERSAYAADPAAAVALLGEYPAENCPPAEAAAWVAVSRAVLNLDEFLTRP
jgi:hypothetical protein